MNARVAQPDVSVTASGSLGGMVRTASALRPDAWTWTILVIAAVLALPVLAVFAHVFVPAGDVWLHLRETVLRDYAVNSMILTVGVGAGVLLLGIPGAWLVSLCEFPGRRWFEWALLAPLAMPAYIIAYTYTGMMDFAGPIQTQIRAWTGWGWGDYWFPQIRSLPGAIVMLSLVLYPYVYLLSRAAFLEQSVCVLEVSRTLGAGPWTSFRRVALPLARPAIVAGLSLALMETLADYGTVEYFGVPTFTTGIFRTWFGLADPAAAAQLASVLMTFVFVLIVIERHSRRRARFFHTSGRYSRLPRYRLTGWRKVGAVVLCLLPVAFGFVIPGAQLGCWALATPEVWMHREFLRLMGNSLSLASIAAALAVLLAVIMAYGKRLRPAMPIRAAVRVVGMGHDPAAVEKHGVYSLELCGGTHVRRTGDIGLFKILSEGAVSAGVRRVEAVTGDAALAHIAGMEESLIAAAAVLKAQPGELAGRIAALVEERRRLEREVSELRRKLATGGGGAEVETVAGLRVALRDLGEVPPRDLKGLAEAILKGGTADVVALVSTAEGKASIVVAAGEAAKGRADAVALVRAASAAVGGKGGGGRPDMAQAGGPDAGRAAEALTAVRDALAQGIAA